MKGLQRLDELLARKNQRFACVDTGWPQPGPLRFTAQIVHHTEPPLSKVQLDQLGRLFGDIPQLAELYGRYGSVRLYVDTIGRDSAYYIATPDEWHGLKAYFQMWLGVVEGDDDDLPDWLDDVVVFGEIPASGNYYLLPTRCDETGAVYLFDHDGFSLTRVGADLSAFLEYITTVNDELIEEILGHTRYSDGQSDTQWLAQEYRYDR